MGLYAAAYVTKTFLISLEILPNLMQKYYSGAAVDFEILDEFNGKKGTFLKSFLISDKINLNQWQTTWDAIKDAAEDCLGRPGIEFVNPDNKKRDHTGADSFEASLSIQELFRKASMVDFGFDEEKRKQFQVSYINDSDLAQKIRNKDIRFVSPSIWPVGPNAVTTVVLEDGREIDVVNKFRWLHYAFVDEPAYGGEAAVDQELCSDSLKQCTQRFAKSGIIENVPKDPKIILASFGMKPCMMGNLPTELLDYLSKKLSNEFADGTKLTEKELASKIEECKDELSKNNTKQSSNISHKGQTTTTNHMATDEELKKVKDELDATKKALEEVKEDMKKESKKGQEENQEKKKEESGMEDDSEKKEKESKKGQETEEEKKQKAETAALIEEYKNDLVNTIIKNSLDASVITKADVTSERTRLLKASIDELKQQNETVKKFSAAIKKQAPQESTNTPYMGSMNEEFEDSFDASVDNMDYDKLMEVYS